MIGSWQRIYARGAGSGRVITARWSKRVSRNRQPLLLSIQGLLPALRHNERTIAEYVLTHPERVISSSIADIHEGCRASVGAIVAFCHRMGLEGFTSLKIELARELAQRELSEDGVQSGGTQTPFDKVFRFHANSLAETQRINSEATLQDAARLLDKACRIEFFSIGISQGVAYMARCKLRLIGLPAYTELDSNMQVIAATQLRPGDVGFGISCSGSTHETVECLRITPD